MLSPLNKVKACSVQLLLGWVTKYKYLCCGLFFSFFPFLFQGDRTAELSFLCNVVSSISQLFVPHFAMTVFTGMCVYLHYRMNKQRDTSFEFSSILSTDDLSNHLIMAQIIRKCIQLVNFETFRVFFFFRQLSMVKPV